MSKLISCMIIDDELNNINLLKKMLQKHCPDITITGTETDALKGVELIRSLQPELVFLDIQMPKLSGFDVLKKLEPVQFEVIFVTAFAEYAIQAFEYHAIGYVTKPVAAPKLVAAVSKAIERIEQKASRENLFSLLESRMHTQEMGKIPLSTMQGLLFVNRDDVIYCESQGNYTHFYMQDGRKIVVSRQLGEFEKLMRDDCFIRIHDRYLINLNFMTEYIKGRGGDVRLNKDIILPVGATRKEALLARFEKWLK